MWCMPLPDDEGEEEKDGRAEEEELRLSRISCDRVDFPVPGVPVMTTLGHLRTILDYWYRCLKDLYEHGAAANCRSSKACYVDRWTHVQNFCTEGVHRNSEFISQIVNRRMVISEKKAWKGSEFLSRDAHRNAANHDDDSSVGRKK